MSTLFLVGAGPGDPELITVKALNVLKEADIVLYDALASEELLEYCKSRCEKIYVGKKPGIHTYQQILINDLIVESGKKYNKVVRLKGGDPFVFGRGYEELEHAQMHGMDVEVIPGISSALAVPASNQIPLTKRGINESFWVVTGTTTTRELSKDVILAAQSSATIVILMGMNRLNDIVKLFESYRGENEPIGIIQNGTIAGQKEVYGRLENIEFLAKDAEISSPAIIIIGEVVAASKTEARLMVDRVAS